MKKKMRFIMTYCSLSAVFCFYSIPLAATEQVLPLKVQKAQRSTPKGTAFKRVPGEKNQLKFPGTEQSVSPTGGNKRPLFREGEVLVRFKKAAKADVVMQSMLSSGQLHIKKRFKVLSRAKGQEYALVRSGELSAVQLVKKLKKNPNVETVSFNYVKYLDANVPDDPEFPNQWPLNNTGQEFSPGYTGTPDADIDAPEAWDVQTGSGEVVVAVLDTGVDYMHPDLNDNMWLNPDEFNGTPGVDDDGNGYEDDIYGIDTGQNDTDPLDIHGHGTHVAGTIAAEGNNGLGIAGVNWNAKIMAVKGFGSDIQMYTDGELEALGYILAMKQSGVNIVAVNASYGCDGCYDPMQKDAIEALGDAGIIFVAAAGNDGVDTDAEPHTPSSYDLDNIISVAATDFNNDLASFSNYGLTSVDLGAPGELVLSTYPNIWYWPAPGDTFFDDMESGSGNWLAEGTWTITTEQAWSPTHGWSDSPNSDYAENSSHALVSKPIDLSDAGDPRGPHRLGFLARYELEQDFDFLDVYFRASPTPSYWALDTENSYSGSYSWTDSPGGNYPNNADSWLISPVLDASGAGDGARVRFRQTGHLEEGFDQLRIYMSADGGANWSTWYYYITGDHTGTWNWWGVDVPPEYRTNQFRFAFVLVSDAGINYDGYYIDDVEVLDDATSFWFDDMEFGPNGWTTPTMSVWDNMGSITGSTGGSWWGWNFIMDDRYLWSQFQVKFVIRTDGIINMDGIYLDEIGIGVPAIVDHTYGFMDGTSMAAPHVSGAVSLMAAQYPSENMTGRINRILSGVDPMLSLTGTCVTEGRLNLYNSLTSAAPCEGNFDPDGDVDGSDLAVFAADFGRTNCDVGDPCEGDFDTDNDVDGSDLAVFAADFGRTDCPE